MLTAWDDGLKEDELAALHPRKPDPIDLRPDVLVIGGGTVGLATAVMCRRAGLDRVLVLDREERLATGASGRAAGLLDADMPLRASSAEVKTLARTGVGLLRALDAEWGGAFGYRSLDLHVVGQGQEDIVSRVAEIDPLRLAAALARHAGQTVTRVSAELPLGAEGRINEVSTTAGTISPGVIVVATGHAPDAWLRADKKLTIKGHLLATAPAAFQLEHGIFETILVRQLADGRILAGSTFDVGDQSPEPDPARFAWIRQQLARLVPVAAGLATDRAWCCFRPAAEDLQPVTDRVPGFDNVYINTEHFRTGLMLSLAAGQALAEWIVKGEKPARLASFAIDRPALR
jgi:glycine/D-amino acid oxidase-like deaminating enzyme